MSKFRDFTKYRWKTDFHVVMWEVLKESYPTLPKWTYSQLRENGWWLAVGRRGYVNLRHTDGTNQEFLMNISGQDMPHMSAMWGRLLGIDYQGNDPNDLEEFYGFATKNFSNIPGLSLSINGRTKQVTMIVTWDAMQQLFSKVAPTPLNYDEPDPRITTSEYFVKEILNHSNRNRHMFTFLPK